MTGGPIRYDMRLCIRHCIWLCIGYLTGTSRNREITRSVFRAEHIAIAVLFGERLGDT